MKAWWLGLVGVVWAALSPAPPGQVRPGTVFLDTRGQAIEAHGGGMIQVGTTWYWIGENKSEKLLGLLRELLLQLDGP